MEYKNIYYTSNTDIYRSLDIFVPENTNDSTPVFIYFHGGGLESGSKEEIPYKCFIENNVCVVSINYRMEMSINVQSKFTQNSETALILQPA